MGSWLPTINVGDFVGNLVGDFKNGEKDLAVMKITSIIRYEGREKTGVFGQLPLKSQMGQVDKFVFEMNKMRCSFRNLTYCSQVTDNHRAFYLRRSVRN